MGDCNGDGYVDTGDTFALKCYILGKKQFTNEYFKKAIDVNKDGYIDTGDTLMMKRYILKLSNLSF